MPTIHDIADRAGVSKSTVSRVVSKRGYVKKDTKEKDAAMKFFKAAMKFSKPPKKMGFADFEFLQSFVEEYCPGITDEIHGLTDGLGVSLDKYPFWGFSCNPITPKGNCSQLALLPAKTADSHIYVGRTYEWTYTERNWCS